MKNYHNIERHPCAAGYLGYDGLGYAWRIQKSTSSFGNWCATSKHHPNKFIFAFGLDKMSARLQDYLDEPSTDYRELVA